MRKFTAILLCLCVGLLLISFGSIAQDTPQLVLPIGHWYGITSVAYSPDSRYVLSCSGDRTLKLWEVSTGREIRSISGGGPAYSVAFSPDGRYILSGHYNTVSSSRLLSMDTDQKVQVFFGHKDAVYSVAFSPDGQKVLTGSKDKTLRLWDISTGEEIRSFSGHTGTVNSVAFSPDGGYALSGSSDRTVRLWNISTGRQIRSFSLFRNRSPVYSVAFSPDGKYALAEHNGKSLKLLSVPTGREVRSFSGNTGIVRSVTFSPDGRYALAGCSDKTLKLWEVATGRKLRVFSGHRGTVTSVAFSPDSRYILSGSSDKSMKLWSIETYREIRSFSGHTEISTSVAISPDGRFVLSGFGNNTLKLWSFPTGREVHTFLGHGGAVTSVAFSPDSSYALSGSRDKTLKLWDLSTYKEEKDFSPRSLSKHREAVTSVAFSPDGRYALSGSEDKTLKLWEVTTGRNLRTFSGHTDTVTSVAFSPDGLYALSGSEDRTIKMWDVSTGRTTKEFTGNEKGILSIAFSPDGRRILSGSYDAQLKLWDVSTGDVIRSFSGIAERVNSVAFSPDGRYALSSASIVKLWDISNGQMVCSLPSSRLNHSVAFSPDGRYVVGYSSHPTTTKLWHLPTGKLLFTRLHLDQSDWVVVTPDGRFDGSQDGVELLHYAKDDKSISLDAFFDKFYTPRLVAQVMSGEELPPDAPNIGKAIEMRPVVRIISPKAGETLRERSVDVVVEAVGQGRGVEDIRLYHNGKRLLDEGRGIKKVEGVRRSFTVSLVNGVNTLKATAYSWDRTEADPYEITIDVKIGEATADLYIVAVGINIYENNEYNLNYGVADAQSIVACLSRHSLGMFRNIFPQTVLDKQATLSGIEQALAYVKQNARPEDMFVFYYAGHGVMSEGTKNKPADFYLIPTDVTQMYSSDELLAKKAFSATQLQESCGWIKALNQLLILDACQAGAAVDTFTMRGAVMEKAIAQLARSIGRAVLASTQSEQFAAEFAELGHGLFTYVLLEALEGKADGAPKDGKVTVFELASYVDDQIPVLSKHHRGQTQYPKVWIYGQDFPVTVP